MLMLGESVLSLLIVDVTETSAYYKTFFSGIISITLLEFLHFRSQPHEADDHALRRSREAAISFTVLMQVYSAALVVLGTSYKMLLYEYVFEEKSESTYRTLFADLNRFLAGGDAPDFPLDERRQRIADFFCISMAIVWLCLDLMILTHLGVEDNIGRCKCQRTGSFRYISAVLVLARIAMIGFIATLSRYVTQPETLAFVGLLGILVQVSLRVAGTTIFGRQFEDDVDEFGNRNQWPNLTRPRAQPSSKSITKSEKSVKIQEN